MNIVSLIISIIINKIKSLKKCTFICHINIKYKNINPKKVINIFIIRHAIL